MTENMVWSAVNIAILQKEWPRTIDVLFLQQQKLTWNVILQIVQKMVQNNILQIGKDDRHSLMFCIVQVKNDCALLPVYLPLDAL